MPRRYLTQRQEKTSPRHIIRQPMQAMSIGCFIFLQHIYAADGATRPACCYFFTQARPDSVATVPHTVPHGKEPGHRCSQGACPAPSEIFFQEKRAAASRKNTPRPSAWRLQGRCKKAAGIQKKQRAGRAGATKRSCARNQNKSRGQCRRAAKRRCR